MKYHFFYFWDAQNPEKNEIVLRQARKVVGPYGPKGPWAHILFNIYLSYSFICLFCLFI